MRNTQIILYKRIMFECKNQHTLFPIGKCANLFRSSALSKALTIIASIFRKFTKNLENL